jgi:hypothetical protein
MGRPSIDDVNDIQQLAAKYALKMTQKDIHAIMDEVFVPEGTYSAFGEIYTLQDFPSLVASAPQGLYLTGTPVLEIDGDSASGAVPLLFVDQTNHAMRMGWYTDTYVRTDGEWRMKTRQMTFLRRHGGADSGKAHDPRRPEPKAKKAD